MDLKKEMELKKLKEKIRKKFVDEDIIETLELINSIPNVYSISSCSGRICLIGFSDGFKKNKSKFVFKSHKKVNSSEIWEEVKKSNLKNIWFNMEGVILHIRANDIENAFKILEIARKIGFKRGGAYKTKKGITIEIQDTEKITLPIKIKGRIIISKKSMDLIIRISNEKLMKTKDKLKEFNKLLCSHIQLHCHNPQ
jgi:tRNA wybutosine-synthesizing protein 3